MGSSWNNSTQFVKLGQWKGKESGINYEYDCITSFSETASFHELSAKYGLDSQIIVDCSKYVISIVLIIAMPAPTYKIL